MVASREAGGRCAEARSADSRAANPAEVPADQRLQAGVRRVAHGHGPAAGPHQPDRRWPSGGAASSPVRRSGRASISQVSSSTTAAYPPSATGSAPGVATTMAGCGVDLGQHPSAPRTTSVPASTGRSGRAPRRCAGRRRPGPQPAVRRTPGRPSPGGRVPHQPQRGGAAAARDGQRARGRPSSGRRCGSARRPGPRRTPAAGSARAPDRSSSASRIASCTLVGHPGAAGERVARQLARRWLPRPARSPGRAARSRGTASSCAQPVRDEVVGLDRAREPADAARPLPSRSARSSSVSRVCGYGARGSACRSSPSSQIATSPRSCTGANAAARVPTTTRRGAAGDGQEVAVAPGRARRRAVRATCWPVAEHARSARRRRGRRPWRRARRAGRRGPSRRTSPRPRGRAASASPCPAGSPRPPAATPPSASRRRNAPACGCSPHAAGRRVRVVRPGSAAGTGSAAARWPACRGGTASRSTSAARAGVAGRHVAGQRGHPGASTGSALTTRRSGVEPPGVVGARGRGRARSRRRPARRTGP